MNTMVMLLVYFLKQLIIARRNNDPKEKAYEQVIDLILERKLEDEH